MNNKHSYWSSLVTLGLIIIVIPCVSLLSVSKKSWLRVSWMTLLIILLGLLLSHLSYGAELSNQVPVTSNKVVSSVSQLQGSVMSISPKVSNPPEVSLPPKVSSSPKVSKISNIYYKDITAYCSCRVCCGKWSAFKKTANGKTPRAKHTVAASRSIPFGSLVVIEGLKGTYVVEDRLATKYDHRIDVYFESHQAALEFGIRKKHRVTISPPAHK